MTATPTAPLLGDAGHRRHHVHVREHLGTSHDDEYDDVDHHGSTRRALSSEHHSGADDIGRSEVSTIGDIVWLDANGDGLQQPDEAGIEGVVVVLLDGADVELARDVTDHLGAYEFTDVAAGSYVLELELPDDYAITQANQGFDDELDSDLVSVDELRGTARTDSRRPPR